MSSTGGENVVRVSERFAEFWNPLVSVPAGKGKNKNKDVGAPPKLLKAPCRITNARFHVMGPEEIERLSVCHVKEVTLYEKSLPKAGGLNDLRMGTVDRRLRCATCSNDMLKCNGHSGHMRLQEPVYHVAYISTLVKILRCICPLCFRMVCTPEFFVGKDEVGAVGKKGFTEIAKALKTKKHCGHEDCRFIFPKYSQVGISIRREWSRAAMKQLRPGAAEAKVERKGGEEKVPIGRRARQSSSKKKKKKEPPGKTVRCPITAAELMAPLTPKKVLCILDMADESVFRALGFMPETTRPQSFIIQVLLVPPPIIRPSIMFSESSRTRGQDDLTNKLLDILKVNKRLEGITDRSSGEGLRACEELQKLVALYMNSECSGCKAPLKKRSGVPEKCVTKRFRGKRGRVRGNLQGKRVNFSARTVISPDATIDVDEVGVPSSLATELTFEEPVNALNIAELSKMVRRGPRVLNGARAIIKGPGPNAPRIELEFHRDVRNVRLQLGWRVERYLHDGDFVLFNRQPSLRKKSIMGHRVKLMPGRTFRLSLPCTSPYNADFDGDEMNLHFPQNHAARAEAMLLASVGSQVLNAQKNKPCMGIVQDSLVGSFLLSQRDTFLTRGEISQLMMEIRHTPPSRLPPPCIEKPRQLWSGKQLISLLMPKISLRKRVTRGGRAESQDPLMSEEEVFILGGELLRGQLCKQTLGAVNGGVVHVTCRLRSETEALHFMSDCQRVVNKWLEGVGFSIGLSDCVASEDQRRRVFESTESCLRQIRDIEHAGARAEVPPHKREREVSRVLGRMLDVAGGLIQEKITPASNSLCAMITSGSKGNPINISQIMACVGQQSIEGHRVFDESRPDERSLSCFDPSGTERERSRGFIRESYGHGLPPPSMFHHTMAGREGIVDTSVKTADTGYLQRRIIKSLESVTVRYDRTVKTLLRHQTKLSERVRVCVCVCVCVCVYHIQVRDSAGNVIEMVYGGDDFDAAYLEKLQLRFLRLSLPQLRTAFGVKEGKNTVEELELLRSIPLFRESIKTKISVIVPELNVSACLPINLPLIILQDRAKPKDGGVCSSKTVYRLTGELLEELKGEPQTLFLRSSVAFHLRSYNVTKAQISEKRFREILASVRESIRRGKVPAGEFVGTLAANSVGEPSTQLTLNTFHHAGVATKNVTLGVPRLKELIDARKNIATACAEVHLRSPLATDRSMVKAFKQHLPELMLRDCVLSSSVEVFGSRDFLSEFHAEFGYLLRDQKSQNDDEGTDRFFARIEIDKKVLTRRGLGPEEVHAAIRKHLGVIDLADSVETITSDSIMDTWEIQAFVRSTPETKKKLGGNGVDGLALQTLLTILEKSALVAGVTGIKAATVASTNRSVLVDEGSLGVTEERVYCLQTTGSSLRSLWGLPEIDWRRTVSNNVHEVLDLLGVEAAACCLFHEVRTVLSFDGCYIDDRHIMMIVNVMTRGGGLMPLNRHGLNKLDTTGPLVKSTFEETVDVFFDAAAFSEENPVNSVSDNITFGQPVPGGTGLPSIIMEPRYVEKVKKGQIRQREKERKIEARKRGVWRTVYRPEADQITTPLRLCLNASPRKRKSISPNASPSGWASPGTSYIGGSMWSPVGSPTVSASASVVTSPIWKPSSTPISPERPRCSDIPDHLTRWPKRLPVSAYIPSSPLILPDLRRPSTPLMHEEEITPPTANEALELLMPTLLRTKRQPADPQRLYDERSGQIDMEEFEKLLEDDSIQN